MKHPLRRFPAFRDDDSGFTLLEIALVAAVVAVIVVMLLELVEPMQKYTRRTTTRENMKMVAKVLSAYAQHNNRIPCPADPDASVTTQPEGMEVGSGLTGATVPNVRGNLGCKKGAAFFNEGIVPYATLGIAKSHIRDGWGNFLSYRVSPSFSQDPSPSAVSVALSHNRCRTTINWITGNATGITGLRNRNGEKARFCCPDRTLIASDLIVQDAAGDRIWPYTRDNTAGNYGAVDTLSGTSSFDPSANNVTAIAFVLVSHGETGGGAPLETGLRVPPDALTGNAEFENQDNDATFVYDEMSAAIGAGHYDDMLLWQTQDELLSAIGRSSCQFP